MESAVPPAPTPVPAIPDTRLRRARAAVATCFFLNAVFYAGLVPRLPEVKADLGLSSTALGAAIAAMPLGSLLAGLSSAWFIRRFGSGPVASTALVLLGIAVWAASVAPDWFGLAAALAVVGALDAVVDVAQNAHGLRVQRGYGRSILNAFHGLWSVGAVAGGLLGSAAAGLGVPLGVHLGGTAVVFGAVAVLASRAMLPGRDEPEATGDAPHAPVRGRAVVLALAALGVLAACGAFVEDAGSSWGALYLRSEVGAAAAVAGLAFVALQGAMTVGRLTGDRVVDRFGQRRVARVGGALVAAGMGLALALPSVPTTVVGFALVAAGMGLALALPSVPTTVVGFALAGLGVATLIPATYQAADELPGLPHGVGLTVINWLLRIGFLVSPALIGVLADAASLRVALLVVVLAGLATLLVGRVLPGRRPG